MINNKITELRIVFKRFVTRLLILAAIVVFGAIAIAQAQRGGGLNDEANEEPGLFQSGARPLENSDGQFATAAGFESAVDEDDSSATTASNEPNDFPYVESNDLEPADWSTGTLDEVPLDDTASSEFGNDHSDVETQAYETADDFAATTDEQQQALPPLLEDDVTEVEDDRFNNDESYTGVNPYRGEGEEAVEDVETSLAQPNPQRRATLQAGADSGGFSNDDATSLDDIPFDDAEIEQSDDNDAQIFSNPTVDTFDNSPSGNDRIDRQFDEESRAAASQDFGDVSLQEDDESNDDDREPTTLPGGISGTGRPGPATIEGPQTPALTIEKVVPDEVQVGKPTKFQIRIRNNGQVPANNVLVRDEIPEGTKLLESNPHATSTSNGALMWEVGTINPGEESLVAIQLMPTIEGQIGSVATVSFQASTSAKTKSTKPQLTLEHTAPRQVMLGDIVRFTIKLSNPGTGTAEQVVLDEDVPVGLKHSSGPKLEYPVGSIQPGQTRHLELALTAAQAGQVVNTLVARGDGGLFVKDVIELDVVTPKLQVGISGPKRRYLEREATFTISVANPGTAAAKNVELVAKLPPGLKFVSTNNSGYYDQSRSAVIWSLETLPGGEMGKAQFKAQPTQMGQFDLKVEASADRDLKSNQSHQLSVEGIAALYFGIVDQVDPIEVGGTTTYLLTVENQGSKTASNVRFQAAMPHGLTPVKTDKGTIQGQSIVFEPISKLAPKAKTSFRIIAKGTEAGDHKIQVQMNSDDISDPVLKEESTKVYAD